MMNFIVGHKVLVGIIALLAAILLWILFSGAGSTTSGSLLTTESAEDNVQDKDLVATLLALRSIKLDGSLFSDPAFMSLKDFSIEIVSEPVGRPNPFAPLSSSVVVNPATTKDAQVFAPTTGKKVAP